VPDERAICRFRSDLVRRELRTWLFAAVEAQFAVRGLVLRAGTPIDATLVEADTESAWDRTGGDDGQAQSRPRKKRRRWASLGLKLHLAVDQGSGAGPPHPTYRVNVKAHSTRHLEAQLESSSTSRESTIGPYLKKQPVRLLEPNRQPARLQPKVHVR
jgi:IS5 family transposase